MKVTMNEAAERLRAAHRVVVAAHVSPDGDAVGSCLGLAAHLRALGKDVRVLIDDVIPSNLAFLPRFETIGRAPAEVIAGVDLLVVLDTDLGRVGKVREAVPSAPVLNIDHHVSNDGRADWLVLERRSAVAEMVCDLVALMGAQFSPDVATPLFTGLVSDTGWFRFANTTPHTMEVAGQLLAAGVRQDKIADELGKKSATMIRAEIDALQSLELFADGRVAGLFIDEELNARLERTEGLVDYIRAIDGVDVALLLKCVADKVCRASLRSKGRDVNQVARQFGGGGHIRAAGCTLKMPLADAKSQLLAATIAMLDGDAT